MKHFNVIIFIKQKKTEAQEISIEKGDKRLLLLNNKQMIDKKIKFCDHVVVNEKNLSILKNL